MHAAAFTLDTLPIHRKYRNTKATETQRAQRKDREIITDFLDLRLWRTAGRRGVQSRPDRQARHAAGHRARGDLFARTSRRDQLGWDYHDERRRLPRRPSGCSLNSVKHGLRATTHEMHHHEAV